MRKNLLITPIAMVLVAGTMSLSAQDFTTGTLAGRVTGPNGQPLQGVTVVLNSPALLAPRQFTTDANGQFRAQMLMGGNYTITYTLSGYLTRRMTTYITAGQVIRGDMQLKAVDVQIAEVEISAAPTSSQQVDKTDTIVQTSYSRDKMLELLGNTDVHSMLAVSSGIISNGSDFRVRGGTARGTKMLVDGGNVTNMMEGTGFAVKYPLTDAVESVAVIQSPMNSRYGNTDGGLISYVLAKGSNEFKGSVRVTLSRGNIWNTFNGINYPNNRGESTTNNPRGDDLGKDYQFYLSGPLWKDHITFTWSAKSYPTYRWYDYQYDSTGGIWVSGNGDGYHPSRYRVGTYYRNPQTGEAIRKAEMLEANDPYNIIPASYKEKDDAYTLFFQLTQNHQLEWSYAESGDFMIGGTGYNMADASSNPTYQTYGGLIRRWNLAYKGIIGTSGLLEARMSSSRHSWFNLQLDGRPKRTVNVLTMPSYTPFPGRDDNNDPNNYYASGLIDALLARNDGIKDSVLGGTSSYNFNATNQGPGDGGVNEPINVNYQHMLQTTRGQHIIDIGFQRERSSWENPNLYGSGSVNGEMMVYSPGRIALDLQPGDIYGYMGTPLEQYRGKFIVFNMNHATFNSIDPYGFSRFNTGINTSDPTDRDMRLIDWNNNTGYGSAIWPRMYRQYGSSFAGLYVQQMSYFLNDLWTINDHHSIMGGLRYDMYKVWDGETGRDILKYNMPTFRFDYKFDLGGDQKRVFNVSWGQFHNMAGIAAWAAFVDKGITTAIWDKGPTDGRPYLVDFNDIMEPNNYRITNDEKYGGTNEVASDFKGLVSTELTLGVRLNLDNGGSLRVSYVTRSWANDYGYGFNGWKDNPNVGGQKVYSRILRNFDDTERSYNSVELEWTIPVTKRLDFGGTYTYSRFMTNASGSTYGLGEADSPQKSPNKTVNYNEYYDVLYSNAPGFGYRPVRLRTPEHRFNAYVNYDLTYGHVKSNVALRFNYVSADPATRAITYGIGYPIVPGINDNIAGVGMPNPMPSGTGLGWTVTDYINIHRTAGPDGWDTNLIYNLEVPVTHKLRWFAIITSSNPFNHRAKSTRWYATETFASGRVTPDPILRPDGSVFQTRNMPYEAGGFHFREGVQMTNANLFAPSRVTDGRSIGLTTGLRF